MRTDQNGSFRSSFNFNRSLIEDKLAIYGAFLYNDQQFERKPSSDLTRRQYGAFTYKPFKGTTIRAFAENYQNNANRPNFLTPRDLVTPWLQAGRPAYDPTTRSITNLDSGAVSGPYVASAGSPGFVAGAVLGAASPTSYFLTTTPANTTRNPLWQSGILFEDTARPLREIDGGNSILFFGRQPLVAGKDYATVQSNPAQVLQTLPALGWAAGDPRYLINDRQWSSSSLNYPVSVVNKLTYTTVNGVPYGNYSESRRDQQGDLRLDQVQSRADQFCAAESGPLQYRIRAADSAESLLQRRLAPPGHRFLRKLHHGTAHG